MRFKGEPKKPKAASRHELRDLIMQFTPKVCVLATAFEGRPQSAVMGFAVRADGSLVLHTNKASRKWTHLSKNRQVAITMFQAPDGPYLQIEGVAKLAETGSQHSTNERIYFAEHQLAKQYGNRFSTATIHVTPLWVRHYWAPWQAGDVQEYNVVKQKLVAPAFLVRQALSRERDRIEKFYDQDATHKIVFCPDDIFVIAEKAGEIVAAVRLYHENKAVLIEDMKVLEYKQQRGIGCKLLALAKQAVGSHKCYCLADVDSKYIYQEAGFSSLPKTKIPTFFQKHVKRRLKNQQTSPQIMLLIKKHQGMHLRNSNV